VQDTFHAVYAISSVPKQIESAEVLLTLADLHPDHDNLLACCAAVVLATALEQGVKTQLQLQFFEAMTIDKDEKRGARIGRLLDGSAWERVCGLPELLSAGALRPSSHRYWSSLRELVSLRNRLVHVNDEVRDIGHLEADVSEAGHEMTVSRSEFNPVDLPAPRNPWDELSVAQGRDFLVAVAAYLNEVIHRLAPETKQMLAPSAH